MNRKFPLYLLLCLVIASVVASCKDDKDDDVTDLENVISNNTMVSSFQLNANDSVLANLDSVFFTIDLTNRIIYNADSLPKGTNITGLTTKIEFATTTVGQFVQKNGTVRRDTTMNYATSDTLDFTGDVRLELKAADGTEVSYQIKVNVHQLEPDSLYWNQLARRDLPNASGDVAEQKTVMCGETAYSLVNCTAGYVLSKTDDQASDNWEKVNASFGFVPRVETLEATESALYVLDENGALYTSTDGAAWTSCGITWYNIIGGYTDRVLGVKGSAGSFVYDEYPQPAGFVAEAVAATFPVDGASQMVTYDNGWNLYPQALIVGGIDQDGKYHGDSWGYDGTKWALINTGVLPALADMTLFQYTTYESVTNLSSKEHRTWIAMGGRNVKGKTNDVVYISRQQGYLWSKGDEMLQLPEYIGGFYDAQALIGISTLTRSTDAWTSMAPKALPAWAKVVRPLTTRTAQAVNQWDCPYIYLYGGVNDEGKTQNNIWKGVINRLTFKPLY